MYVHRVSRRGAPSRWAALPRWVRWALPVAIVALVGAGTFYGGAVAQRSGQLAGLGKLVARPLQAVRNFGEAHLRRSDTAEPIYIDLKFKHYQKLLDKRKEALAQGFLFRDDDDFVPGKIRTGGDTLPVKLRLKGDLLDHLRGERWSFRIRVRDGKQFHGMRRFSIQHPRTREYVWEWAVLEAMRREGILAPRYGYVDVTLNGKQLGLYAFEEHFGKELLESQGRREGVIVKFNESWRWREMHASGERTNRFMFWQNSPIDAFNDRAIREDPDLMRLYEAAVANLESLRQGRIAACDAFACDQVARFWALADLLGAAHALHWINLRYYYNPITTRLEPVAFDCLGGHRLAYLAGTGDLELAEDRGHEDPNRVFMADPRFAAAYLEELRRVSRPEYVERLRDDLSDGVTAHLRTLHREWPWEDFDWGVIEHNRGLIQAFLNPPAALTARYDPAGLKTDRLRLRMANLLAFPVEVVGVRLGEHEQRLSQHGPASRTLAGKPARGSLDWEEVELAIPAAVRETWTRPPATDADGSDVGVPDASPPELPEISILHRILGESGLRESIVERGAPEIALQGVPRPQTAGWPANDYGFLEVDRDAARVHVRPGRWEVDGDLVVPRGWTVIAGPGTVLQFDESAVLLSYSPVEFAGREDSPVVLAPKGESWGGLQVLEAGGQSILRHVRIRGTAGVDRQGWILTGGVTFYESPVTISTCVFEDSRGEDALNVVRSSFRMSDSLVRDTAFDAVDIDFGEGTFEGCRFTRLGNDALDFSGSTVRVEDLIVLDAGDKGISAGEASDVTILSARIENATVGIASKDRSQVRVSGCEITGSEIAIAAFQKKPEFGGAFAFVQGAQLRGNERDVLVEIGSTVELNGTSIPGEAVEVANALY